MLTTIQAQKALEAISNWPIVKLCNWPTPVEQFQTTDFGSLLVKRDDLAEFGRLGTSGVKARKLEGFLGYIRWKGVNEVVIPLGNLTNLGHDIVPLFERMNIGLKLLIVNKPQMPASERATLFKDIIDRVELISGSGMGLVFQLCRTALSSYSSGRRPVIVFPSLGHPSAVIGAARGYIEVVNQLQTAKQTLPSKLFISVAAGTTILGLALGQTLLHATGIEKVDIIGVQVTPHPLKYWLPILFRWTCRLLGIQGQLPSPNFQLLRIPQNLRYGRFNDYHEGVCTRVQKHFGLTIDPIYGGKCWFAMENFLQSTEKNFTRPVMFWHCGYTLHWPSFREIKP